MTNQTAGFEAVVSSLSNIFTKNADERTLSESVCTVVGAYYAKTLSMLTSNETRKLQLMEVIQEEVERYSHADLGSNVTALEIIEHVTNLSSEISKELYKETNNNLIQSVSEVADVLLLHAILSNQNLTDRAAKAHNLVMDSYIEGLEVIDDAGELGDDQEREAVYKINIAYIHSLSHLKANKPNFAVSEMQDAVEDVESDLDF